MNIVLIKPNETSFSRNDERYEHIKKILHKKIGDTFDAGIINGDAGIATITAFDEKSLSFDFKPFADKKSAAGKKLYPVTLIVGFPRPIQLRRLFRDVASLGVKKIILVGTELGEKSYLKSNVVTDGSAKKMLIDGAAQAASTNVTELEFCESLKSAISDIDCHAEPDHRSCRIYFGISASRDCNRPRKETPKQVRGDKSVRGDICQFGVTPSLKICLDNVNAKCSLGEFLKKNLPTTATGDSAATKLPEIIAAIGSERGWSDNERALLEKHGFTRCSMGERILRTETAATVATSIILEKMGVLN